MSVEPGRAEEGQSLTVKCALVPQVIAKSITLKKDGTNVEEGVDTSALSYHVKKATVSDSGRYVCRAVVVPCCSNGDFITVTVHRTCPCS